MSRRVVVIGLDCAPPALVFDRLRRSLPNLASLMRRGAYGAMRSSMPPITMPAWACMMSGRDPGELGVYGFRKRAAGRYELTLADATDIAVPRVWDVLGAAEKRVAVLYVPPTSPPSAVNGQLVSCFLTPSIEHPHTYPPELAASLAMRFGAHAPDVGELRRAEPRRLLDELYTTTRQHFAVARALWAEESPDFLMMVEMGTDRLHHGLWRHLDTDHPEHDPHDPLVREARDYYAFVDAQLGALLELVDDETAVLVVSDHGARRMEGAVRINELLRRAGFLVLREEPSTPVALRPEQVDWSRTRAWGEGGYYSRIFFNVEGREREGIVSPDRLESEVNALVATMKDALSPIAVSAERPVDLYRTVRGVPPELMVVFGDLAYRASSSVGPGPIVSARDERGDDGANHDWDGIFIAAGAGIEARGELSGVSIYDVGKTVLSLFSIEAPADWLGRDRSVG